MKFNHVTLEKELIDYPRVNIDGKRHYQIGHVHYPSITTVLGSTSDKTYLKEWRERIGDEAADRISNNSAKRGTNMHQMCEDYLNNNPLSLKMPDALEMFYSLKPILNRINNIHCQEKALYSHKIKIAGSVDCIGEFDNILSVIDFKNSRRIKKEEDITLAVNNYVIDLQSNKNDLSVVKSNYEDKKQSLVTLNKSLSNQTLLVDQATIEKNQLLVETKNKESNYQKLLEDRQSQRDALEAELNDIESKLLFVADLNKLPKPGEGVLAYPLEKIRITQYFGNTTFAKRTGSYAGKGHNGIDFAASVGTPVYTAKTGIVLGTGNTDLACKGVSYGKWVLIKHANGLTTLYSHLSLINVKEGQVVKQGEQIALSGSTGFVTGPHLHFSVFASDSVHITSPIEYKSKVCNTYLIMPVSPFGGYLNPLLYL